MSDSKEEYQRLIKEARKYIMSGQYSKAKPILEELSEILLIEKLEKGQDE